MDFTPSVYEHAAALIGRSPWEVSRDEALVFEGHAAAYRRYRHTPVVVGIDIYNLEAEAYGARVGRPEGNATPAVELHPCPSLAAVRRLPHFDPAHDGRIPMMIRAARRLRESFPEADVRAPVSGPFSIACALVGFENLLCGAATDPGGTREALRHLAEGQLVFCREVAARGLGLSLFESAATPPLLSPGLFREVELPALEQVTTGAAEALGQPVACIMGGNTEPILEALLSTGARYVICPVETDQAAFMRKLWNRTEVRVRINMDLRVLVRGPWNAIRAEADRVVALAGDRPNVCIGTGALPYETPPENVQRVSAYLQKLGHS